MGWSLLVGGSAGCGFLELSMLWVLVPITLVMLVQLGGYDAIRDWRTSRRRAREEPIDEWIVELHGDDLGVLRDATFTDMFWKTFQVIGSDARLFNDSYWLQSRFSFRHATSGRHATTAFCGGLRATREAPHVSMRGLC